MPLQKRKNWKNSGTPDKEDSCCMAYPEPEPKEEWKPEMSEILRLARLGLLHQSWSCWKVMKMFQI